MEIRGVELKNFNINLIRANCPLIIMPNDLSPTFASGVAYSDTITFTNATGVTLTGLPSGITYTSTVSYPNVSVTVSGTPTTQGQSFTITANATNSGDGLCTTVTDSAVLVSGTVS
jgi:hypothetical protein